jgi:septal ring factor EnvC (AmiA/AmiB activator)
MVEKERLWKDNVDKLEGEFRGMIMEVNQKYKLARDSLGERNSDVEELKGALKVAFGRSKDLEMMVNEMNDALMAAKNEIESLRNNEEAYRKNDGKEVYDLRARDKKLTDELRKTSMVLSELRDD